MIGLSPVLDGFMTAIKAVSDGTYDQGGVSWILKTHLPLTEEDYKGDVDKDLSWFFAQILVSNSRVDLINAFKNIIKTNYECDELLTRVTMQPIDGADSALLKIFWVSDKVGHCLEIFWSMD